MEPRLGMKGEDQKEIMKTVVKMDLISDEECFIYFNDLLFKTMRRIYGEEKIKNKAIA